MAHMIEGNNAFYTNQPAWHGLGTVLQAAPTVKEAWQLAYPHNLFKLPIAAFMPEAYDPRALDNCQLAADLEAYVKLAGHCAIVRDDQKQIGVVGADYELVQPYDAFAFFEPFLETGKVALEAGGSLCDGSRMWALAKITSASADIVPGDGVSGYLLVYTSFDGSLSHGIQQTNTRVVCQNTLSAAIAGKSAKKFRFKHTSGLDARIQAAQSDIALLLGMFEEQIEQYRVLASKKATGAEMVAYVARLFEVDDKEDSEVSGKMRAKVQRVVDLIDDQAGLDLVPAARGTMWQAYNAVTEYLTHEHGHSQDSRLNSQWFGDSAKVSAKALELALNV